MTSGRARKSMLMCVQKVLGIGRDFKLLYSFCVDCSTTSHTVHVLQYVNASFCIFGP